MRNSNRGRILAATGNPHKIREMRDILEPLGVDVLSPSEAGGLPEPVEDAETFEGNAAIKAVAAWRATGLPSFADDSGLAVAALGGRPGVRSARYAGADATDSQRVEKLLGELRGVDDRRAAFVCAVAVCDASGAVRTFRGVVDGSIAHSPAGDGGFGYDPIFIPEGHAQTFGQLPSSVKHAMSHRGRALRAARDAMVAAARSAAAPPAPPADR